MMDPEGFYRLLGAVVRQWIGDARDDPAEMDAIATWLDISPQRLQARLQRTPMPGRRPGQCQVCGRPAVWSGRGRHKKYCSGRCSTRARKHKR